MSTFDVEIAELIAGELGRTPQFVHVAFVSLDQSAIRGDFDVALCGIEDTPQRRAAVAASVPHLGNALRGLAAQGRTLVFTAHDDDFVGDSATRVLVLAEGRVVEEGNRETCSRRRSTRRRGSSSRSSRRDAG